MSPDLGLDVYALLVIFAGLAIGSFIKGLIGTGLPLVAVPFMAGFLDVEHAIVVVQIPGLISNAWLIWSTRREAREIPLRFDLLLPAVAMVITGVWFLDIADERLILLLLAIAVAIFLLIILLKPSFRLEGLPGRILTPIAGAVGGFAQGATGISGPLFSTLVFSFRLNKEGFVFYNALLFGIFNLVQTAAMAALGMFTLTRLMESAMALLPMVVFQYLGMRTMNRVSIRHFNRIVIAVIVLMEFKLIWEIRGA